ncbi:MAG: triose-phosphate isomerase [Ostreibacterium sp.]
MRKMTAAANWKMNGRYDQVNSFSHALNKIETDGEVIFAPPSVYLGVAQTVRTNFSLSAQTASENTDGAFTGELSMSMLSDIGCQYVILGHSERRIFYGETDEIIFNKIDTAFKANLIPILCIGETDKQNQSGQTDTILNRQLEQVINQLSSTQKQQLVIAYEPVWAIGTGRTPSIDGIQTIHEKIRYLFSQNDDTISGAVRILYGGSVKPDNVEAIFALPDIDGGLVGGASLTIDSFKKIIKAL